MEEIVPSWSKFMALSVNMLYDRTSFADKREFARVTADGFATQLSRLAVTRRRLEEQERARGVDVTNQQQRGGRFCDVDFDNLVRDPKATVRAIYEHFGYEFTPSFSASIDEFMVQNPRYKHGRPEYSLAEFGLDKEVLRRRFKGLQA